MSKLFMFASVLATMSLFACYGPTTETKPDPKAKAEAKSAKYVTEDGEELSCHWESPTGSHMEYKVCRTKEDQEAAREAADRAVHGAPAAPLPPIHGSNPPPSGH